MTEASSLHRMIAAELRRRISDASYPPASRLPSEAALCREFGTSRGPVRQAVETLRQEGLVAVSRGSAPRVLRGEVPSHPFEALVSFTEWAQSLDRTPGQRTVDVSRRPADCDLAARLRLELGAPVVHVLRLRLLDGEPVMLERAAFPLEVGRLLFDPGFDPDAGSIYRHLAASGVDLHQGRHLIDAVAADEHDARLLQTVPGAPLLRVRRQVCDRHGRPLEAADDRYLPGSAAISIDNEVGHRSSSLSLLPAPAEAG